MVTPPVDAIDILIVLLLGVSAVIGSSKNKLMLTAVSLVFLIAYLLFRVTVQT